MISGHLHKPVIILNLQEREPALEERLNCSVYTVTRRARISTPGPSGRQSLVPLPLPGWAGVSRWRRIPPLKIHSWERFGPSRGGEPGEAEHAHETPRTQCSVPLWRRPGGHTGLLRPPSQPGGTSAAGRLDSDAGSATSCATSGMPLALSASVTQYSPHRLFRRSQEVTFALHTADAP